MCEQIDHPGPVAYRRYCDRHQRPMEVGRLATCYKFPVYRCAACVAEAREIVAEAFVLQRPWKPLFYGLK